MDGMDFSEIPSCPFCGGAVGGHDWKRKKFAVLREPSRDRIITIRVKRFYCRTCANLCYADEPFYPDTRIGSLIIDLFSSLCATMPANHAARVIDTIGIIINRTTWRSYTERSFPELPVVDVFGIRLPISVVRISALATQSGRSDPVDVLAACGYPSRTRGTGIISRKNERDLTDGPI